MSKNIKMGVFGLDRGSALLTSIEAIEGVTLHAVCDKNTEQYEKIKSTNDALTDDVLYFTNFDEFIESGIEAVFLANYFHEHCKFAIRCLEKGIAVLSDTTAAATLKECVQLCETVEKTGTKYMLGANVLLWMVLLKLTAFTKQAISVKYFMPRVSISTWKTRMTGTDMHRSRHIGETICPVLTTICTHSAP